MLSIYWFYFFFYFCYILFTLYIACLAPQSTEIVMDICHGKRKCSIKADSATFGKPCSPESRMYLKVVYTCGE